jgi:hypothetical protein
VESDIAEAEALIRRMDLEARSLQNPSVKTPLLSKLRDYKAAGWHFSPRDLLILVCVEARFN